MSGVSKDRHVDRTIALFLRDLDLAERAILILTALE